jgi:lipopolysaccharide export system permease protein
VKILDRYVAREVLSGWLQGVGWFAALWYSLFVLSAVTRLATKVSVAPSQLAQLMLLEIPQTLAVTMPMGMLYGALMAFARFTNDGEISAMLTSGVSFHRLMPPVAVLGVLGSLLTFGLNEIVVPPAVRAKKRIVERIEGKTLSEEQRAVLLREPSDLFRPVERILSAERFVQSDNTFIRPDVFEYRNGVLERIVSAEKGIPQKNDQEDRWTFINASTVQYVKDASNRRQAVTGRMTWMEMRVGRTPEQMRVLAKEIKNPDEMNWRELREYYKTVRNSPDANQKDLNKLVVDLNNKLSLPLSCLLVGLIGPPLALRRQRTTSSLGFGISFLIIVGYFLVWNVATLMGKTGGMDPTMSSWLADVVSAVVGSVLIWRAGR